MILETIWFFLWGLLWAVYFMTDGFDLGIGTLMPFVGKSEEDKRVMVTSMGPLWDGNEVWLLTAGGVTFAAFPQVYAVMFSSLYSALMLILFALILRGVAFEFRSKVDSDSWRKVWDACLLSVVQRRQCCSVSLSPIFFAAFPSIKMAFTRATCLHF